MSAGHAKLSASGSKRWLTCTPSAEVEKQFPESTSEYAEEGSFAHSVGELKLRKSLGITDEKDFKKEYKKAEKNKHFSQALVDYVDQYVTIVLEKFAEAKQRSADAIIRIEQRLDFSQWVPDGFGTGDTVIIADQLLEIIDYKHGEGVAVNAEDNSQMRLYALGAIAEFGMLYDFDRVKMTIVQPRLDSVSSEEITVQELLKWAEEYVRPRAELAIKGEGEFIAGDHCQFCRAKVLCRARAKVNLILTEKNFKKPELLQDDEIGAVLTIAALLVKWADEVKKWAFDQALNHGKKWEGWKLVEGRSDRTYTDKNQVETALIDAGYEKDKIFKPQELLGITAMEDLLGKKQFGALLAAYIIKPPGDPTLVPESDKRGEWTPKNSAADDFAEPVQEETITIETSSATGKSEHMTELFKVTEDLTGQVTEDLIGK
jgi:hypothetical protein